MKQPEVSPVMPHTQRVDNPEALAKHAITLLEKALARDFGVRPVMGAELEFSAITDNLAKDKSVLGLVDKKRIPRSTEPSVAKPNQRDAWFPESRRIAYCYHEAGSHSALEEQMEIVISHQAMKADGTPLPNSALTLARTIEATRNHIVYYPFGYYKNSAYVAENPSVRVLWEERHAQHKKWAELREKEVDVLRFDASNQHAGITNGMHLNTSFVDARSGKQCLDTPNAAQHLKNGISTIMEENLYLLGSQQPSLDRFHSRFGHHTDAGDDLCKSKNLENKDYIENRIPPADANPYYAVMLQLAGVYATLQKENLNEPTEKITTAGFQGLSAGKLWARFHKGIQLRGLLNHTEPALGDRFMAAIERTPPGRERSAQQRGL